MIASILWFLLIFSIMCISHEFGHFIVAKKNGINVVEFFIGMGPKILKKEKNGTEFSLRLLPLGGACVFEGADALMDDTVEPSEHAYQKAPVWSKIATTIAGPLANILLAYICGVILAAASGEVLPVIQSVMENSAAEEAGIMPGDVITSINGHSIHLSSEVSFASYYSEGEPLEISVKRDGEIIDYAIVPKYDEQDQRYYIGITNGEYLKCGPIDSLKYGFYNVQYILRATVDGLRMLITGKLGKDALAGPVGMTQIINETYTEAKTYGASSVILSMINLMMFMSANLAVMNLLPIPGLDGGKLLLLIIELIRRKPLPPEKEGYVTLAGMALLLALVVFVLFNDITKLFR